MKSNIRRPSVQKREKVFILPSVSCLCAVGNVQFVHGVCMQYAPNARDSHRVFSFPAFFLNVLKILDSTC